MKYIGENAIKKLISLIKGDLATKQPTITASGLLKGDGAGTISAVETQEATLVDVPNGLLKGDGTTISTAVAETDYMVPPTGGTTGQVLKKTETGTAWEAAENDFSILDKSSLITTPLGDKLTWQIGSFSRWGAVCIFTVQFIVDTEISSDYGFDVVTLPYRTTSRIWVNNQSAFWIDARGNTIRRNGSTLGKGAYTLSGFYLTNDPE